MIYLLKTVNEMYLGLTNDLPFPAITSDSAMRNALAEKTEIRFMEQENGTTVCSYVVSAKGTFDGPYNREARGIVFDKYGFVISRPLHKFFNVNEREETLVQNIDWSKVTRVMLKRDGSMIHTVPAVDNVKPMSKSADFTLKSKKSFESDVAVQARDWINSDPDNEKFVKLCNHVVEFNQTATFEWTSPTARIVVYYETPGLKLLHVRDNCTGYYLNKAEIEELGERFGVPVVESCDDVQDMLATDPKLVLELAHVLEGIEGWVIQFEDGNMVKLKTQWYYDRHGAMTFLRERDVAQMVIDEKLDDLKALLVGEGVDITDIEDIEARVVKTILFLEIEITATYEKYKHMSKKELALLLGSSGQKYQHFRQLMQLMDGVQPDYTDYYEKKMLKDQFTLRQLNMIQTTAEVE